MKVRNQKANHSLRLLGELELVAVLASMKVRNQKANHNQLRYRWLAKGAVLASVKVRNLKANHNRDLFTTAHLVVMVIGCCSA